MPASPASVGGAFVAAALLAGVGHLGLFFATGQEAYPLTAYPMYAGRVAQFRAFYEVEATGPGGAVATLSGAEMFDRAHSLENSVAQKQIGKLRDWQARGCVAATFADRPACAGSPVDGWSPPADLVALWTSTASARLGWTPESFSVYVRDAAVAGDASAPASLAFSFAAAPLEAPA